MSDDLKNEDNLMLGKKTFLTDIPNLSEVGSRSNEMGEDLLIHLVQKAKKLYKDFSEVEIKLDRENEVIKQINSKFEQFLNEMLEVGDFWEKVLVFAENNNFSIDKDVKNIIDSFQQGFKLFQKKLIKAGIEPYEPKTGEHFIPGKQYCIGTENSDQLPEGVISKLEKRGYIFNGRLLRPAYVIVVKNKKEER